jgi:hypothetical protein
MVNFKKLRQMIEVKGNGNIVSREISVSTFVRLHLGCKGIVELHQSDEEKVIVETDENLLDYIYTGNAGRTLYISLSQVLKKPAFTSCKIKVYFRQLNVLYLRNESGSVICNNEITLAEPLEIKIQSVGTNELWINAPSIKINSQAVGNTLLKGSCEKLEIKNHAVGSLDASQMKAGEVTIKNHAVGNVQLHADRSITISHHAVGFIHYTGNAVVKDVKQYGQGEVKRVKEETT